MINVKQTMNRIISESPILKEMIDMKHIEIIGGIHNISTGEVTFI